MLGEDGWFVASKSKASLGGGLRVIPRVRETLEERESNRTVEVVTRQPTAVAKATKDRSKVVVKYKPVWAIGTG